MYGLLGCDCQKTPYLGDSQIPTDQVFDVSTLGPGGVPLSLVRDANGNVMVDANGNAVYYDATGKYVDQNGNATTPTHPDTTNPAIPAAQLNSAGIAAAQSSMIIQLESWLQNAATGTLSESQKEQLIQQETQNLVKAGMNQTQALQQATSDVTVTLVANQADPSQASVINSPGVQNLTSAASSATSYWPYVAIGAGILLLLAAVRR